MIQSNKDLNFTLAGDAFGGYNICLDLIPTGSTIISAGLGANFSFDEYLVKEKKCKIVGIDPTAASKKAFEAHKNKLGDFTFLSMALSSHCKDSLKVFKRRPELGGVSESLIPNKKMCSQEFYETPCTSIAFLREKYKNISVLKMDIEGAEYSVIKNMPELDIPQICVEFHNELTGNVWKNGGDLYSLKETTKCIKKLHDLGYTLASQKTDHEFTFVHKKHLPQT